MSYKRSFSKLAGRYPGKKDKFVVDDHESDDENTSNTGDAKMGKKRKVTLRSANDGEAQEDEEGNTYWELGGRLRRVTVSEFKSNILISIREHYEKDGKILPGKKGISLTLEQYNNLLSVAPYIEDVLQTKTKDEIARPEYSSSSGSHISRQSHREVKEEEDDSDTSREEKSQSKGKKKIKAEKVDEEE